MESGTIRGFISRLEGADDLQGIVEAERAGAETYWRALAGIPLRWESKVAQSVPAHWLHTQPRESYRTGNRYGATDPVNGLLNYGYSLLEAETRIASLIAGLHPGLGIFHADKDGRASFVYDVMEPARPIVDRLALDFIHTHTFLDGECWETREGFCRLDPALAAEISYWTTRTRPKVVSVVRETARHLAIASRTESLYRSAHLNSHGRS